MSRIETIPSPDTQLDWSVTRYLIEYNVLFNRMRMLWPIAIESLSAKDRDRVMKNIDRCMRYYRNGLVFYEEQGPTKIVMEFFEFGYKTLAWIVKFLNDYIYAKEALNG